MDSLERPPADPSGETYIESFCQLLDDSWTLTNLDSGDIRAVEPPVWDKEVDQWLDDLMDVLEVPSNSLEDLLEDMSPDEWAQVLEDVVEPFDLDAFVT